VLEPLTVGHAEEMVEALSSPDLYEHIGGTPPDREGLERLYRLQTAGRSPSGEEGWLNWIIRETRSHAAIGYVQATVTAGAGPAADSVEEPATARRPGLCPLVVTDHDRRKALPRALRGGPAPR
jgi:hypothetical protein